MSEITRRGSSFVGYEYMETMVFQDRASMYIDGYMNFGWILDDKAPTSLNPMGKITLKLKRDRKLLNKTELTRLQRHFEACMVEIEAMEKSKTSIATMWALIIAFMGTAFMTGAVFAVVHEPPLILLSILLALPAFIGWLLPPFAYKVLVHKKTVEMEPLIEGKYDELYEVCEKGNRLITN